MTRIGADGGSQACQPEPAVLVPAHAQQRALRARLAGIVDRKTGRSGFVACAREQRLLVEGHDVEDPSLEPGLGGKADRRPVNEDGRSKPAGKARLAERGLDPARRHKMGWRTGVAARQERGAVEQAVTFERRAAQERGNEPGRKPGQIVRGEERQDPIARSDLRRHEIGRGAGRERRAGTVERCPRSAMRRERDQPGIVPQLGGLRVGPRLGRLRKYDPVEIDDPVGNGGAVGAQEAQPEAPCRDRAKELCRPLVSDLALRRHGLDAGARERFLQVPFAPGRRQQAWAEAGLLARKNGDRRLRAGRQADADRASWREAQAGKESCKPRDRGRGKRMGPFEPRPPAPGFAIRLVAEGDLARVASRVLDKQCR
jgi:hypothetical protein